MKLAPGDRLGRYVIERLLGEGGMGEVYRARDTSLQRSVAIKLVTALEADDEEAKLRLRREAQAAAALAHDGVIAIYDVGEDHGRPYVVMELLAGSTLRQFIGDATISIETRIAWLHDVAAALDAAHQKGIVHRDIKPENVFVRENGSIKVLDFGLARRFAPSDSGEHATMQILTGKGEVVGTPQYMSPEQMNGEELDGRSDQFAWAMLAYELLSGRVPFVASSPIEMVAAVLTREPELLSSVCPDCPLDVVHVVMRALSKRRDARFESMRPIVEVLAPFAARAPKISVPSVAGEKVVADAPTVASTPSLAKTRRMRSRSWIALLPVAILALVAAFVATRAMHPRAVAITDLPVPRSANAEAERAYRAGLQGARDAAGSTARTEFQHALALDPGMVAAHVWLAQMQVLREPAHARNHLARAAKARASLSERDADALYVLEPFLLADPGDAKQSIARLAEVLERRPGDAALHFLMAELRAFKGDDKGTIESAQRAFALDPKYAAAWLAMAWGHELAGDDGAAIHALERCIEVSALASSCRLGLIRIHAQEGDCDRVVDETKRWVASSPEDAEALRARGEALASRDLAWTPAALDLLAKSRELVPEKERATQMKLDEVSRALFEGKLDQARTLARSLDGEIVDDPSLARHAQVAQAIVMASLELGDSAGAAAAAEAFVNKEEIWVAPAQMWRDPTMAMLSVMRDAGRVSPQEFDVKRDAWVRTWRARPSLRSSNESWIYAFAEPARSAEDARAALSAKPDAIPAPRTTAGEVALAHVDTLAGNVRAAIDRWSRASKSCHAATEPVTQIEATVDWADALRSRGDTQAACAAYGAVIRRWGAAPESKSMRRATEGSRAARCP